ncbi:cytochrome C oxidase subunit IV family protein [Thalassotalea castellviae]|uniref:cytochrome C oxidase subunit IV family protein n=1 Tax=Thalassotalea castellviae TaxID=3075612 RepID=UPI003D78510D
MTRKQIILSWLSLICLTCISVFASDFIDNIQLFIIVVMLIVFIKGQQIVDVFMELKTAPTFWRLLLISYTFLIPLIISIIYLI